MPIDLSSIDISMVGWVFIIAAAIVLGVAILRFFGHLLHIIIQGCGVVLLVAILLYILRLFHII
jgi:hypothetical protein